MLCVNSLKSVSLFFLLIIYSAPLTTVMCTLLFSQKKKGNAFLFKLLRVFFIVLGKLEGATAFKEPRIVSNCLILRSLFLRIYVLFSLSHVFLKVNRRFHFPRCLIDVAIDLSFFHLIQMITLHSFKIRAAAI